MIASPASATRHEGQVPYYTRAEIDGGALEGRGLELLYLDDPVELFYMQVQGSGVVRLPDGSAIRLTYAGKNGYPYTSIGKLLVERGEIAKGAANMEAVKAWLHADPARGRALMEENRSYVFFAELGGETGGPIGGEGVPLTPGRSLAVDAAYHRLGLPVFVTAPDLADETGRAVSQAHDRPGCGLGHQRARARRYLLRYRRGGRRKSRRHGASGAVLHLAA